MIEASTIFCNSKNVRTPSKTGTAVKYVENKDLPLRERISFRLQRVGVLLTTQAGALLKTAGGLTLNQWRLMTFLSERQSGSVFELSKLGFIDKATLSRAATELLKRGLIVSEANPEDRRATVLRLTETGREVLSRAEPGMQRRQASLMSAITEEERETLFRILDKLEHVIIGDEPEETS